MVQKHYLPIIGVALVILLVAVTLSALTLGPAGISVRQTVAIVGAGPSNNMSTTFTQAQHRIIWQLRLPRILSAMVAGVVLAVSGMVYQALFRNPMADPYVLGISSGAAFGVAFAAFLGVVGGATGMWQVPVVAFLGAAGTALVIMVLSGGVRRSPTTLLLTGIALNFLLSALMTLFMYLNRTQLQSIMQWTLGSFGTASWSKLGIMGATATLGIVPIMFLTRELDILLLDEASALSIGVSVKSVRLLLLILSTLATSVTVAFCGIIGFVGLMVPHIMRLVTGPRHKPLMLFSTVGGALMMVGADTLARTVLGASELPVGIVTALAGAPLFIILLANHRKENR
ncbi:MAG: iron ABC transporter permease [Sphaerochaeta sp.]|jgi:iron complex transport system permease protein|nr:iron ABC transporter permease [Sphaerochaeta sp.]PKL27414.1 MAG: iron ABC transporter permease [Spirochaetae bacterium HGW-Spirochaetae-2]